MFLENLEIERDPGLRRYQMIIQLSDINQLPEPSDLFRQTFLWHTIGSLNLGEGFFLASSHKSPSDDGCVGKSDCDQSKVVAPLSRRPSKCTGHLSLTLCLMLDTIYPSIHYGTGYQYLIHRLLNTGNRSSLRGKFSPTVALVPLFYSLPPPAVVLFEQRNHS